MKSNSLRIISVFLFHLSVTCPAFSETVITPYAGFEIPTSATSIYYEGQHAYSIKGALAVGFDLDFGSLPFGTTLRFGYLYIGNIGNAEERQFQITGNHLGVGVVKSWDIGGGVFEFSASCLYRDEDYEFERNPGEIISFDNDQLGGLIGTKISAPFSDFVSLSVLTKMEITSESEQTTGTTDFEEFVLKRSATSLIFGAGLRWIF